VGKRSAAHGFRHPNDLFDPEGVVCPREVIVEPDADAKALVVVTAYPIEGK